MSKRRPWVTTAEPITKYNDDLLKLAFLYLESYDVITNDVIPSWPGLAVVLQISPATLTKWYNQDDKYEIAEIMDRIKAKQEVVLINKGLLNGFNSSITKLALTKHGYSDKQDNNITATLSVNISDKDAGTL